MPERRELLLQRLQQRKAASGQPPRQHWPLTSAQLRVWFQHQHDPLGSAYSEPTALRLRGPLSEPAVSQALARLVERHEALRTHFLTIEGQPRQRPGAAWAPQIQVRSCQESDLEAAILELCSLPFDLETGPLLRARLFRLGPQEHVLVLVLHHLIVDGWSADQLARELVDLLTGQTLVPAATVSYVEYALEQASRDWSEPQAYWQDRLQGLEALALSGQDVGGNCARFEFSLTAAVQAELAEATRTYGCTTFSMLLLAWGITLAQWTGSPDLAVAVPVSQRPRQELEQVVGLFLNTLPIRMNFSENATLADLCRSHWTAYSQDLAHQSTPLERILSELPPVSSMLNLQPVIPPAYRQGELEVSAFASHNGRCKFPLCLNLQNQSEGGWAARLEYAEGRFSPSEMSRLVVRFQRVLEKLARATETPWTRIGLPDEEAARLAEWENGPETTPVQGSLLERFREQVRRQPGQICLRDGQETLTYAELEESAGRLACGLLERGIGPGQRVVVSWPRVLTRWVGLLAVLKAGATFVPVEADEPEEWLAHIAQDCDASLILRHTDWQLLSSNQSRTMPAPQQNQPLALLYTSGSSGRPKAVAVSWPATLNRFEWMWRELPFDADDVLCHRSPFGFVDALWELFGGLLAGQPTAVISPASTATPVALAEGLEAACVTRLVMVPSLLEKLLGSDPGRLRQLRIVVSSGEALSPALAGSLRSRWPWVRLLNLYGSTEVAGDITWHEVLEADRVPLGRPLPGCRVQLLNGHGQPVPLGSVGEIYLSGANLAAGYWSGPEGRFQHDPVSGERRFRSGDLGSWDEQGNLHYHGRADRQFKLRGIRLQPEFLESQLLQLEGVREAFLSVQGDQLVAFVAGQGRPEEWGQQLRQRLPRAYWPDRLVLCDFLPRNGRGKVDGSALSAPLPGAVAAARAGSALEESLLQAWRQALGREEIGVHHDFFELGGNSLTALGLLVECEKVLQRKIPLAWLFDAPTVARLAARLQSESGERKSNLVTLQSGEGPPLVFLHAMGGGLDYYQDLIRRLPGREIWGFFGLEPGSGDWTLNDLASTYVEELVRRYPTGPCTLLGLSLGGSIAYQMACRLQAEGREARLIIIDTYAPGYYRDPDPSQQPWVRRHRLWQRLQLQLGHLLRRVSPGRWPEFVAAKLVRSPAASQPNPLLNQWRRALANYRPPEGQPALGARTLLLRANYQPWHLQDPWLGWKPYLAGASEVLTIPGMHGTSLVEEPIVRALVEPILRQLQWD
jgi:amino acid adenylation domain-containing protein